MSETKSTFTGARPLTENRNPATTLIDRLPLASVVDLFVDQDRKVAEAVSQCRDQIARAVEIIVGRLQKGGRLVYLGAGTSGRLGILDASECPPTFGVPAELVVGLIAGGEIAVTHAVEGAEDDGDAAVADLKKIALGANDTLVGVSASGVTPYVRAGLAHARSVGGGAILLTCNPHGPFPETDVLLNPVVGPEVITGSTRLKSGTACKMVLNMLSSISMIRLGKVYQNLMVDVKATNRKLRWRSVQIVAEGAGIPFETAEQILSTCDGEVKTAIVASRRKLSPADARAEITRCHGILYKALGESETGQ
ncbi:MAG TPA: N-acetylmuramic acid 6-phosphate etherase [Candidatus Ozemobacteraceae bacterium]|nr:N-acetylmuramic acid 6-phosphate etherase [Candidatus Ozemobacteraceae bacterium]